MRRWCRCVFDQADEGKRGLIGVQEYLNAWGKELGVVLSALTVPLLLGILSVKDVD